MLKRMLAVLMVLALLLPCTALAAKEETNTANFTTTTTGDLSQGPFPELNAEGFLTEGEYVYANPEEGVWRYVDDELKVEIIRYQSVKPDNKLIWYEAEIWTRGEERFRFFTNEEGKHMSFANWPHEVARKNGVVFGVNTDFAQNRYPAKKKVGVIIRNEKIFIEKTVTAGYKYFPNLDVLALWPDGDMKIFESDAHTGQEYLDMGVTDTLAFGPILVDDGVVNEEEILKNYNGSKAPRTAVGMVEKGHYFVTHVEGRTKNSNGCYVITMAHILKNRGCVEALNLDGGETAFMVFMGEQINTVGNSHSSKGYARKTTEVFGVGVSDQVPAASK